MMNAKPSPTYHYLPGLDVHGLEAAFDLLGIDVHYDNFSRQHEFRQVSDTEIMRNPLANWVPWNDRNAASTRAEIAKYFRVMTDKGGDAKARFTIPAWTEAINALGHKNQADTLIEYQYMTDWDCVPRIERLLIDHFGAEDTPYNRWVSALPWVSAVARAWDPGCRQRVCAVLIGGKGIGKSAFVRSMCPKPEWLCEGIDLLDHKAAVEATLGKWIVELPELAGVTRAEVSRFKAFISTTADTVRKPYERHCETIPRRFVMIGTGNDDAQIPNEEAAAARFATINLRHGCNVEELINPIRELCFAEANTMLVDGFEYMKVPSHLEKEQQENNSVYVRVQDEVHNLVSSIPPYSGVRSTIELARENGLVSGDASVVQPYSLRQEFINTLRHAGFTLTRIRVQGSRKKGWQHPREAEASLFPGNEPEDF